MRRGSPRDRPMISECASGTRPRVDASSLPRMLATCRLTVCRLRSSARAMCLLLSPPAICARTSSSRGVNDVKGPATSRDDGTSGDGAAGPAVWRGAACPASSIVHQRRSCAMRPGGNASPQRASASSRSARGANNAPPGPPPASKSARPKTGSNTVAASARSPRRSSARARRVRVSAACPMRSMASSRSNAWRQPSIASVSRPSSHARFATMGASTGAFARQIASSSGSDRVAASRSKAGRSSLSCSLAEAMRATNTPTM
jgi:hypothetical protein